MYSIWKYKLNIYDTQTIEMQVGAKVLSVQVQNDELMLWAFVNTEEVLEQRSFNIYGTGHEVFNNLSEYIGTIQMFDGHFVGHVFEIK